MDIIKTCDYLKAKTTLMLECIRQVEQEILPSVEQAPLSSGDQSMMVNLPSTDDLPLQKVVREYMSDLLRDRTFEVIGSSSENQLLIKW